MSKLSKLSYTDVDALPTTAADKWHRLSLVNLSLIFSKGIKIAPAKPEVFNVSRSKRLQGRFAASRLATKVAE